MPGRILRTTTSISLCIALALLAVDAHAQASRALDVGTMFYSTNEALTNDDIAWPRDITFGSGDDREMLDTYGIIIGVNRTWTDPGGVTRDVQVTQIAHNKYSDIEAVTPPVPGAFQRTYRQPFPMKVIDGIDRTDVQAVTDPVDPSIPSDVLIYHHLNSWSGIDIERWAYAFAHEDFDDLVILEYKFTNTSGEPRNDVYIGLTAETSAHTYYPANLWGSYYGATYADYVAGDPSADSLRLWYSWDADQTSTTPDIDDRASPEGRFGHFQEPQFMGHLVLHADAAPDDETNDPTQPWKAGWSQRELAPDLNVASHEDVYQYLTTGWDPANPGQYAQTVDGDGNVVAARNGPYRVLSLDPPTEINNTTQFDPVREQEKTALFSFGPYNLDAGEDVRIVTAFVGGMIDPRIAIDAGAAYQNGNPQQRPLTALPYDVVNPVTGEVVAQQGTTLDKRTKNAVLDIGKDILFERAGRLADVWNGSDVKYGSGSFDMPLAPASPSIEGFSENDQVRLTWGQEAEQDPAVGPISAYRIYRELIRPSGLEVPTDTLFLLHEEVPAGTSEFVDSEVVRGEQYYYYIAAVTEVDGEPIEGSGYLNRTGTTDQKFLEAVSPTRPPDPNWQDNVVVVPNPFHIQGANNYEESRRLNFLNLPPYANIHIYTVAGDRVQTLAHDVMTGDEDWERQETFSTMEIVSGIYIYVVEELDGPNGSPTGEQAIGKFVVIK